MGVEPRIEGKGLEALYPNWGDLEKEQSSVKQLCDKVLIARAKTLEQENFELKGWLAHKKSEIKDLQDANGKFMEIHKADKSKIEDLRKQLEAGKSELAHLREVTSLTKEDLHHRVSKVFTDFCQNSIDQSQAFERLMVITKCISRNDKRPPLLIDEVLQLSGLTPKGNRYLAAKSVVERTFRDLKVFEKAFHEVKEFNGWVVDTLDLEVDKSGKDFFEKAKAGIKWFKDSEERLLKETLSLKEKLEECEIAYSLLDSSHSMKVGELATARAVNNTEVSLHTKALKKVTELEKAVKEADNRYFKRIDATTAALEAVSSYDSGKPLSWEEGLALFRIIMKSIQENQK